MNYLLPILLFSPLFFAGLFCIPSFKNAEKCHKYATIFSAIYSILSFFLFGCKMNNFIFSFSPYTAFRIPIIDNELLHQIGIHIAFGVDSLSIIMIILTSFVFFIAILVSKSHIKHSENYFYSLIFLLESILMGLFTTTDMFVFFFLWEIELIPMYLLISLWGNKYGKSSALKYVIYTFGGSLFLLIGIILLYFTNISINNNVSADMTLLSMNHTNVFIQLLISSCFLIGFGVKLPIIPLHKWLAEAHTNSTTPVSIILAAVLLKLAVYGIIRFNISILTLGFAAIANILGLLAIINIIVGAALAYYQKNIKKMIAYSSISQMGIILLALSSLTPMGYVGSVFHSVSHGIISAGLFILAGIIKNRYKTNNINRLSGVICNLPSLYWSSTIITLGAIGIPFLSGFIGEFLTIYSAFASNFLIFRLYAVIATSVLILSGLYILKFVHNIFYGEANKKQFINNEISLQTNISLYLICFTILVLGICPMLLINFIN